MSDIDAIISLLDAEAQPVLQAAREEARARGCFFVGVEHVFVALVKSSGVALARALSKDGHDPKAVRDAVRRFAGFAALEPPFALPAQATVRLRAVARSAAARARTHEREGASQIDLVQAILIDPDSSPSIVLSSAGIDLSQLAAAVEGSPEPVSVSGQPVFRELDANSVLGRFGRDLTRLASRGELGRAIGRDAEVREVMRALCRQTKNAPLVVGEAGVGKTALIEELANRIARGEVPDLLLNKRIVEVTMGSLVAGTKYRGEFEERIEKLVNEAKAAKEIILFIDEIHSLVGAGSAEGAPMDAGDMVKPALARGEIRVIGATTPRDYARSIEKDAALSRRFQLIRLEEPSPADAKQILAGRSESMAKHHGLEITPAAIEAAVELSVRYLPDRRLPDKAIDLLDEACVRLRIASTGLAGSGDVTPDVVADALAAKTGIPIDRIGDAAQERLMQMEATLGARVIGQEEACRTVASQIRLARAGLRDPRKPIGVFFFLGPSGVGKTELAKAVAEFLAGSDDALIRADMSEYQERHTISRLIGSPPGYVGSDEEGQLTKHIRRRPSSVVLLDEIEKAHPDIWDLFLQVFDDGRLTDAQGRVADCRHAVFVMTSNAGSDLWAQKRDATVGFAVGGVRPPTPGSMLVPSRDDVLARLKGIFRPEFLNRVDELILFRPLDESDLMRIAEIQLERLFARIRARGLRIEISDDALRMVARLGYDPSMGARPIERAVEDHIAEPLSSILLSGKARSGAAIRISERDHEIIVSVEEEGQVQ